jgi:hypothetical protein
METINITYNFLVPVTFALAIRLLAHVARGRDPYGAFGWAVCWLPRHAYAAVGTLILVGQFFSGRTEPSVHLHALFMGWLVGMVVLHVAGFSREHARLHLGRGGFARKRY